MTDIDAMLEPGGIVPIDLQTMRALVDEIERLRKERSELREALAAVSDHLEDVLTGPIVSQVVTIDTSRTPTLVRARAALSKAQGGENE